LNVQKYPSKADASKSLIFQAKFPLDEVLGASPTLPPIRYREWHRR